jgi:3-oxoacyl-[acyl-carrier protein] reductase
MELRGQVALVTGASRGIGQATALALAQAGAAVMVGYHQSEAGARDTLAQIEQAGGVATAYQADVADPSACEAMVQATATRFGRLDILVNNAGTALEKLLQDTTLPEWDRLTAIHLNGMFVCSRAALGYMTQQRYGRIITISSIWGITGAAGEVAYSTVKAGQIGFTKALAQEVGGWGITVNAVAPGAIATDMTADLTGEALAEWLARTPVGRLGTASEVAQIVRYLAGQQSGFITGQVWSLNGGVVV